MSEYTGIKPPLTIAALGKGRFYISLAALSLILLVQAADSYISAGNIQNLPRSGGILTPLYLKTRFFHSLNIAALGMGLVVFIWLFQKPYAHLRQRNRRRQAILHIYLLNFIVLFVLQRLPNYYPLFPNMPHMRLVLLNSGLAAYVAFQNSWNILSTIYRCQSWRLLFFTGMLVYAVLITGLVWFIL